MARKKQRKNTNPETQDHKASGGGEAKPKREKDPAMEIPFLKNVLVLIVLFFTTYYLVGNVKGYKWLQERFIEGNLNKLERFADLTTDQKYQAYFRFNHQFLNYIKENTPDSAIIYMPPDSIIMPEDGTQTDFYTKKKSNSVLHKVWATYFIYPRRLVYDRERGEVPGFDRYTHVACIDGWGYDYLEYPVPQNRRAKYQLLPRTEAGLKRMNERAQKQQEQ